MVEAGIQSECEAAERDNISHISFVHRRLKLEMFFFSHLSLLLVSLVILTLVKLRNHIQVNTKQ